MIHGLLRKVFGPERGRANLFGLSRKSLEDWMETRKRVHVRFKANPQESLNAQALVDLLLDRPEG